jgi:hypothetical protein
VVKGTTRTWVNLPGAKPLFCVSGEFNEGLVAVLPNVIAKVQEVLGTGPVIEVFDRGGYCGRLFEQQMAAGHTIITYRKGKTKDWPLEKFEKKETRIGSRTYQYAPAEAEVDIPVHDEVTPSTGQKGAPAQGKTGRTVRMREIRIIREDGGQTSMLVGNSKAPAVELCGLLFGRWGAHGGSELGIFRIGTDEMQGRPGSQKPDSGRTRSLLTWIYSSETVSPAPFSVSILPY